MTTPQLIQRRKKWRVIPAISIAVAFLFLSAVPALAESSAPTGTPTVTLPQPGGPYPIHLTASNTGPVPFKITSIVDNVYGDLATRPNSNCGALIGATLAPGAQTTCMFTGSFTGVAGASQTDTVTIAAVDSHGTVTTFTVASTVVIASPPASHASTGVTLSLPQPGGTFPVHLTSTNPGPEPFKITSIVDNIFGNLATRPGSTCGALIGTTLAPGAHAACQFTGTFTGVQGASQTDVTTVDVIDSHGTPSTDTVSTTVVIGAPRTTRHAVTGTTTPPTTVVGVALPPNTPPLALTGTDTTPVLAGAAGLVVLGTALLIASRTRRRGDEI
jgi:hypothetical protein